MQSLNANFCDRAYIAALTIQAMTRYSTRTDTGPMAEVRTAPRAMARTIREPSCVLLHEGPENRFAITTA